MPQMNIDAANQNLRWCLRAWKDGEMQYLALYLYRKAISQLSLEDVSPEIIAEVLVVNLGREVAMDISTVNTEITSDPYRFQHFQNSIGALFI